MLQRAHPVFQSAAAGDFELLDQFLREDPQLVNRPDYDGNMPLHWAARSGCSECVEMCLNALSQRPELDLSTEIGRTNFMNEDALCCAVASGNEDSVAILLRSGAKTDYRFSSEVPPLVEALRGSNTRITRLLLETLEVDFTRSRLDRYWFEPLKLDLTITLEQYKLMKTYAVPYGIGDFEELYLSVFERDIASSGLEDFFVYICTDAVDRWTETREEVLKACQRVTLYFLRKLVPHTGSFACIRRLQRSGIYKPPSSAHIWLRVFASWGSFAPICLHPHSEDQLLLELVDLTKRDPLTKLCPLVHDSNLIPLILYFAFLTLQFPRPTWLTHWEHSCANVGFADCSLSTLFEINTIQHSNSASDFFWIEVYPFVVNRAISTTDLGSISVTVAHQQLSLFLQHVLQHCPAMLSECVSKPESLFLRILTRIPASSKTPSHELFLHSMRQFVFPWFSNSGFPFEQLHDFTTIMVHVFSGRSVIESILDFSPSFIEHLIGNPEQWPNDVLSTPDFFLNCLLLAFLENRAGVALPHCVEQLFGNTSCITIPDAIQSWFLQLQSRPPTLFEATKRYIRVRLRASLRYRSPQGPRQSLSEVARQLPLPAMLYALLLNPDSIFPEPQIRGHLSPSLYPRSP
ncbi:unnamed protein product [Dicrocoelium dendriticum]|nr:unnamed protein product [Dicrocoelium dendriticum]